jgi:hypothetical protein
MWRSYVSSSTKPLQVFMTFGELGGGGICEKWSGISDFGLI